MELGDRDYTRKKDRKKRLRSAVEVVILVIIAVMTAFFIFGFQKYDPYAEEDVSPTRTTGFVALSYLGVDRVGRTADLISAKRLDEHLHALHKQGFVTVTEKDIEDYYKEGKKLPRKALYLMFEDGRRDTVIFAQQSMEKYNFHGTIFSYASLLNSTDTKFLNSSDLKTLVDSTFWDLGSNGYRLRFINVYDKYGNFLDELSPLEYASIRPSLGRNYNHYLMDYLRDEQGLPKESYRQMQSRIAFDYEQMRDLYTEKLGYVPHAYVLMHANTTQFGNNNDVSAENERWIRDVFALNFNREGYSFNQPNSSIYDLTRMQPRPYWPVNHLLMRIKYDVPYGKDITFEPGGETRHAQWSVPEGAMEIDGETLYITTLPNGRGEAILKGSDWKNLHLTTTVKGGTSGRQQLYIRADEGMKNYICVELAGGDIIITERLDGKDTELYKESLSTVLGETVQSVEEEQKEGETREFDTLARYAKSGEQAKRYEEKAQIRRNQNARTVAEGAEAYEKRLSDAEGNPYAIAIDIKDDDLRVTVNGVDVAGAMKLLQTGKGRIVLGADRRGSENWSQRNSFDDVYDAVFQKLEIKTHTGRDIDDETVLYTLTLSRWQELVYKAHEYWESILNVFLEYI